MVADVYSADNVSQIMNLKAINRYICRDLCYYLIRKRCYRGENRAMPLKTSVSTEIYCASRGGPCDSVALVSQSVGQKPLGQNPLGQNPLGQKPTRA